MHSWWLLFSVANCKYSTIVPRSYQPELNFNSCLDHHVFFVVVGFFPNLAHMWFVYICRNLQHYHFYIEIHKLVPVYGVKQTLSFSIVIHIMLVFLSRAFLLLLLLPFICKSHNVGYSETAGKRILFDIFFLFFFVCVICIFYKATTAWNWNE